MMQGFFKRTLFASLGLVLALALPAILAGCGENGATDCDGNAATILQASLPVNAISQATKAAAPKPEPKAPDHPRVAKGVTTKEGFQVELLHQTDKANEGSWVALCKGPDGTLYASAQYMFDGKGKQSTGKKRPALFQLKPPAIDDPDGKTQVIPQPVEINGAQGLYYGFGALYVMESGKKNGLVRVTDSNGDGLLDKKERLLNLWGGGEHGTHAIVPTADGQGLYLVAGNMSPLPAAVDKSRSRSAFGLWDEDHVLPRNRDGRGHASSIMAPGGWILRVDSDGTNVELISHGYRNPYDIGVHPNGEVFAYDADMEWDLGQPWYRPTRINHVTSGSEFGWRNGSGKWPAYYEDSLGSVVDLGPGSPVGVTFGTGADFPTKYQQALYALDWTYGTIYAIHLEENGASYTGKLEPFVMGKPLPVTDVAIGDDGAMYFTAGGRRGDSAFYRVSYYGVNDRTPPAVKPLNDAAKIRKRLEKLHTDDAPADSLDFVWEKLDNNDRHIRFAARVALEHRDPASYLDRALAEKNSLARTAAGLALARHRHPKALDVLMGVDLSNTGQADRDKVVQLAWMRALAVDMYRKADIDGKNQTRTYHKSHLAAKDAVMAKLKGLLPSNDLDINTEVLRLRVAFKDEGVIKDTLNLMSNTPVAPLPEWTKLATQNDRYGSTIKAMINNPPPTFQIGIAFHLRHLKEGWTPATRQAYFSWLRLAAQAGGGNSYWPALNAINKQAQATLSENEKLALGPWATEDLPKPSNTPPIVQPKGPGRDWQAFGVDKTARLVQARLKRKRDFNRGVGLYQATLCSQCHRVGNLGGEIGPNLSTASNKFSVADLLRATVEPSHEISDQYAMTEIVTKDGKTIVGRMLEKTDKAVIVEPDPRQPENKVIITLDQIKTKKISEVSTMPIGLVNSLSVEELTDLVAYIMAGGDKTKPAFKQE